MYQPNLLETPEWAIQAFEKATGLQVVVHDLASTLWPVLQPERFRHHSPCCLAVKARHDWACVDFEITRLRGEIPASPEGRVHRCHAGYIEWVVPVFIKDRLAWILFAGQRRPVGDHRHLARDIRTTPPARLKPAVEPPEIRESEAEAILESLRQLRSRLLEWHGQAAALLRNTRTPEAGRLTDAADRRLLIQRFLHQHHTGTVRLQDLARALHLGESRTSHLVKDLFGCTYVQLVGELRLRTAASLLRESSLSVMEVGLNSGFRDVSHFHRCFQRRFSRSPREYRRLSRA